MAATIPATNKWLLTKQVSVAQSAERWQAGDGMEAEAGGPPGSSLAEFLCKLVVQGLRQHKQAEEAVGAQRKMKAAEMEKRKREPETRLVRGWGCGWVSANAWTVQKRLGTLALWSRCLSCLYHTACLLSSAWLQHWANQVNPSQSGWCSGHLGNQDLLLLRGIYGWYSIYTVPLHYVFKNLWKSLLLF